LDSSSDVFEKGRVGLRERARTRLTLQQRQKQDSRQRLVAAMREALLVMPYAAIAVEDIAARAELSRVTFYKHFESKYQIGKVLHDQFRPLMFAQYRKFAEPGPPDLAGIVRWIDQLLDFYAQEKRLIIAFGQMMVVEPEFTPVVEQQSRDILGSWADSIPSLAVMRQDTPAGAIARIDGRLILSQLNDFCYGLVVYEWRIDRRDGLHIMARNLSRFISDQAELTREQSPSLP